MLSKTVTFSQRGGSRRGSMRMEWSRSDSDDLDADRREATGRTVLTTRSSASSALVLFDHVRPKRVRVGLGPGLPGRAGGDVADAGDEAGEGDLFGGEPGDR